MQKITNIVHMLMRDLKPKVAIDFTLGSGNDFLYMAKFNSIKKIYGFDIQQVAIEEVKPLLSSDFQYLICDSHANFDKYVTNYDLGVFNFGYYPKGDHTITTLKDSSEIALKKALYYLNKKGTLMLVVYPGHDEGKNEAKMIDEIVSALNPHYFQVMLVKMCSANNAPYLYVIERVRNEL